MKIEIVTRWTQALLFSLECGGLRVALEAAVLRGAVLRGADLRGADLSDAVLRDAVLRLADLSDADLSDAVLSGADLRLADLRGADLRGAVLRDADLRDAVLSGAVLRDAVLRGADLRGADLRGADLRGADLRGALEPPPCASRSDGYDFVVTPSHDGAVRVRAGCHNFTFAEAREHWGKGPRAGTRLGDESLAIVDHLERMAQLAGWMDEAHRRHDEPGRADRADVQRRGEREGVTGDGPRDSA